jgi:hypothetical protein
VREILSAAEIPDDLLDDILSRGPELVPELIDALEDEGWAAIHAVEILGELRDDRAIEPLLDLLARSPARDVVHDRLLVILPRFGDAIVEAALARRVAPVLAACGARDERILALLLDELDERPELLGIYGDPRALGPLADAFDALDDDADGAAELLRELKHAIEALGGELNAPRVTKYLRASGRLPGPEAPCWCQSGKKYRACHMGSPT